MEGFPHGAVVGLLGVQPGPEQGPTQDLLGGDSNHTDPRWSQGMPERQWESGQSSVRVPAPYAGAE